MLKQDFLDGTYFKIGGYDSYIYKFSNDETILSEGYIEKFMLGEKKLHPMGYVCNVFKITKTHFTFFSYVMNEKVKAKYKFENLTMFNPNFPAQD